MCLCRFFQNDTDIYIVRIVSNVCYRKLTVCCKVFGYNMFVASSDSRLEYWDFHAMRGLHALCVDFVL